MAKIEIDEDLLRRLSELINEADLSEIEIVHGEQKIRLSRTVAAAPVAAYYPAEAPAAPVSAAAPAAEPSAAADAASHPGAVPAPMVGTAYLSPEPGAAHFVNVGDSVTEGETLLLIEAMKTFNPVRAPKSGKIAKILVSDASPVEYGEVLMIIE